MKTFKIVAFNVVTMRNDPIEVEAENKKQAVSKVKRMAGYQLLRKGLPAKPSSNRPSGFYT
jgi:hypothetical protein